MPNSKRIRRLDMKVNLITLLIMLVCSIGFVQAQVTPSTKDGKIVEEIRKMDRQWIIEAYSTKDLSDFDRIVADDFSITGASGKMLNKAEKRASVAADYTATWSPGAIFKIDEASYRVRVFDKTAISTGYIIENYMWKEYKIDGHVHFTNVYLKRNGLWQVVSSHFTNIKQT